MTLGARKRSAGQAMVEFALVSLLLVVMFVGIMDFGYFFAGKVAATNAVRWAARFAATNSSAWSNAANPPSTSIEGQLKLTAIPAVIINDDQHIVISYMVPGTGTAGTPCGHYQAANPSGFVAQVGYTQATCVLAGNLVTVSATYTYKFITPILSQLFASPTIATQATEIIET